MLRTARSPHARYDNRLRKEIMHSVTGIESYIAVIQGEMTKADF
jgi:hypothetical protein